MKPISKITLAVNELGARPQGCSTREVMDACGGQRKAVQACVQRYREYGRAWVRNGVDQGGIRCSRYFLTEAAAEAYVFQPGYYDQRDGWKNSSVAKYAHIVAANPAISYADLTVLMGLTVSGAARTLGRMVKAGKLFTARKMDHSTRRPVNVLFATAAARDEWQAANPLETLGHREAGWRGEPKPKAPKEPKVKATRSPKKNVKRSALSVVKRKDAKIAEVRAGMSQKAFDAPTKPKGSNVAIKHEDSPKVTIFEDYAPYKHWVDPASVPRFSYGSAVAA